MANHAESAGVWLLLANRGAAETSISYDEAVEVGLCYGWIDGQARRVDSNHRYVTDPVLRLQMIARGYVPEGYGEGVAMCAPP